MKSILITFLRFVLYCFLMFLCWIPIDNDFKLGKANESNMIEYAQHGILFIAVFLAFVPVVIFKHYKVFMAALGLFIILHIIREFDAWFDGLFPAIGWFPFVVVVLILLLLLVVKNFKTLLVELDVIKNTIGFGIVLIGLANLHVFTRLYGKPSNWRNILGENYSYNVERASEESVELVAYTILLIGIIELVIFLKSDKYNGKVPV